MLRKELPWHATARCSPCSNISPVEGALLTLLHWPTMESQRKGLNAWHRISELLQNNFLVFCWNFSNMQLLYFYEMQLNHTPSCSRNSNLLLSSFCFCFCFFLWIVSFHQPLWMAPDRKPSTEMQRAPGAWPLNAQALPVVVTAIKRLFWTLGGPAGVLGGRIKRGK